MSKTLVIKSRQSAFSYFSEVWDYRNLLFTFTWRDFRVRYAQSALGILWSLIQPLLTFLILWLVFVKFLKLDSYIIHPGFYVVSGVVCWNYFSFVVSNSGQSVIQAQQMVKKIFFPKIILPLSKAALGLVDLLISQCLMFGLLLFFEADFSSRIWFLPLAYLALIAVSLGFGIWVSALTIRFRDLNHVTPFLLQIGLYITPVAYPASLALTHLPKWAQFLYYGNPITGVMDFFRWCLFDGSPLTSFSVFSIAIGVFIFITGAMYFHKTERSIADII